MNRMARSAVVIGVGNEYRRDDGLGPAVLARLRDLAPATVRLVPSDGDPGALIEAWSGAGTAIVVDAVSGDPGRTRRLVIDRAGPDPARTISSHGLGLAEAIGLARALDRMPGQLIVHAVEAADFGYGLGLTPAVAVAADAVTSAVLADLGA
jgi:hydrogenase maturation protease